MITIRRGLFETNSSSTHVLTICTKQDHDRFLAGELVYNQVTDELCTPEEFAKYADENRKWVDEDDFWTDDNFGISGVGYDTFSESFTTPSGDEMVAFGYFGRDG